MSEASTYQLPNAQEVRKTSENITSTHEVIGQLPDMNELINDPWVKGGSTRFIFAFNATGELEAAQVTDRIFKEEIDDPEAATRLITLMEPVARLAHDDQVLRHGQGEGGTITVFVSDSIVEPRTPTKGGNVQLHIDPDPEFYVAAIGASTLYYDGAFESIPINPNAEWDESLEEYDQRAVMLEGQVAARNLQPTRVNSGDITLLTDETVHKSPERDVEVIGQRRTLFTMFPLPPGQFK